MQQRLWQSAHPPLLGVKSQAPRTTSSLSPNIRASVIREWRFGVYSGGMEGCNIYVSLDVTFVTFSTKLLSCNFPPLKKQRISAEGCKTRFLIITFSGSISEPAMLKPMAAAGLSPWGFRFCSTSFVLGMLLMVFLFGQRFLLALLLRVFSSSATVPAGFTP